MRSIGLAFWRGAIVEVALLNIRVGVVRVKVNLRLTTGA